MHRIILAQYALVRYRPLDGTASFCRQSGKDAETRTDGRTGGSGQVRVKLRGGYSRVVRRVMYIPSCIKRIRRHKKRIVARRNNCPTHIYTHTRARTHTLTLTPRYLLFMSLLSLSLFLQQEASEREIESSPPRFCDPTFLPDIDLSQAPIRHPLKFTAASWRT